MKHASIILLFTFIFLSCNKKSVLLPETDNKSITEILDVSPVYLFYDETKPDSIDFNRKNMIGSTNWLVNIDKRLTLKQIMPHIIYLQEKRNKDGMHKNENAKNYFTCSNPEIQNLAFIEFTDMVYTKETTNDFFKKNDIKFTNDQVITVYFHSKDSITIDTFSNDFSIIQNSNLNSFLFDISQGVITEKQGNTKIVLDFNETFSFQDYINFKSELLKLDLNNVEIIKNEFIHN